MFLPIGDEPNPRQKPWVTWLLIALNIAVYVLITLPLSLHAAPPDHPLLAPYLEVMRGVLGRAVPLNQLLASISAYDLYVFEHGFKPAMPALDDAMVSMFLHGGFMHLAGNMLFLWIYGDNVEVRLGRVKYVLAYLGTGLAGMLLQALFSSSSLVPVVGASGAISGVLGFYFVFFPKNRIKVAAVLFPFYMGVMRIPARWVLGVYLVLDNLVPFILGGGIGGVAHGAHIGGFVAGWLLARFAATEEPGGLLATSRALRSMPDLPPVQHGEGTPPFVIRRLIREGNIAGAAREYAAIFSTRWRTAVPAYDALTIADDLVARGHHEAALGIYQAVVHDDPEGPYAARAHLAAGDILLRHLDRRTSAYQHYAATLDLHPAPSLAQRAREGLAVIQRLQMAFGH